MVDMVYRNPRFQRGDSTYADNDLFYEYYLGKWGTTLPPSTAVISVFFDLPGMDRQMLLQNTKLIHYSFAKPWDGHAVSCSPSSGFLFGLWASTFLSSIRAAKAEHLFDATELAKFSPSAHSQI